MQNLMEQKHILIADDDVEDCILTEKALKKTNLNGSISFVHDGEELLSYLRHEGDFNHDEAWHRPELILLDLNMPRKDGREALSEIKKDDKLKDIPIIVLTTSRAEEDVHSIYELGANSYITKPVTFPSLVEAMAVLTEFWFDVVKLPIHRNDFQDKG